MKRMAEQDDDFDIPDESEQEYEQEKIESEDDGPRVAQYTAESDDAMSDDLDNDEMVQSGEEDSEEDGEEEDEDGEDEEEDDEEDDMDSEEEEMDSKGTTVEKSKKKNEPRSGRTVPRFAMQDSKEEKPERPKKEKKAPVKRTNKHAPQEITSKRPVSRIRPIIEDNKPKPRDPRFSGLSGTLNSGLHAKSYAFLDESRAKELDTLRQTLRQKNLPETDRERIKATLKRLQSVEDRRKREQREKEAITKWKKDEKEKQATGKKAWHLKKSAVKELLLKDRFEQLSKDKRKLQKVLDRKRRKISAKDKKSMPTRRVEQ